LAEAPEPRRRLLMLFDLNGFEGYNDSYGRSAGDESPARSTRTRGSSLDATP
jgi:hypothetical protein